MATMDLSTNQEVIGMQSLYEYAQHMFKPKETFEETDIQGNINLFNTLKTEANSNHGHDSSSLFQVNCPNENEFEVENTLFSYSSFKKAMDLRTHNRTLDGIKRTIFEDAEYFAKNYRYQLLPITLEPVDETVIQSEHNYSLMSLNSESEPEENCSRTMDYSQIKEKNYKRRRTKFREGSDADEELVDGDCLDGATNGFSFSPTLHLEEKSLIAEEEHWRSSPDLYDSGSVQPLDLSAAPLVQQEKTDSYLRQSPSSIVENDEVAQLDSDKENVNSELNGILVTITRPDEKENYQPCDLFLNDIARLVPKLIDKDCLEVDILDRTCDRHDEFRRHRLYYVISESTWRLFQKTNERVILTNDQSLGQPLRRAEKDEKPSYLVFDQFSLAKCLADYCQEIGGCFEYTCVEEEKVEECLKEKEKKEECSKEEENKEACLKDEEEKEECLKEEENEEEHLKEEKRKEEHLKEEEKKEACVKDEEEKKERLKEGEKKEEHLKGEKKKEEHLKEEENKEEHLKGEKKKEEHLKEEEKKEACFKDEEEKKEGLKEGEKKEEYLKEEERKEICFKDEEEKKERLKEGEKKEEHLKEEEKKETCFKDEEEKKERLKEGEEKEECLKDKKKKEACLKEEEKEANLKEGETVDRLEKTEEKTEESDEVVEVEKKIVEETKKEPKEEKIEEESQASKVKDLIGTVPEELAKDMEKTTQDNSELDESSQKGCTPSKEEKETEGMVVPPLPEVEENVPVKVVETRQKHNREIKEKPKEMKETKTPEKVSPDTAAVKDKDKTKAPSRGTKRKRKSIQRKPKISRTTSGSKPTSESETSQKSDKPVSRKGRKEPVLSKEEPPKKISKISAPEEPSRKTRSGKVLQEVKTNRSTAKKKESAGLTKRNSRQKKTREKEKKTEETGRSLRSHKTSQWKEKVQIWSKTKGRKR